MNRLSNEETLSLAMLLTKKLALDLDADDFTSIPDITKLLSDIPLEAFLFAFRQNVGIERTVHHDLDENKHMKKLWNKLAKGVVEL
jgi:hypothetical protein